MKYPESMKAQARELHSQGHSIRSIARILVFPSRTTVWRMVNGVHDGPGAKAYKHVERKSVRIPEVEGDGPTYPDIDESDKDALIERLQLENAILRGVNELLKGVSLGQMRNRDKALLINWLRQETSLPLRKLTASLRISKSSYEYWRVHLEDENIRDEIADDVERIFTEEGKCARGYRFVHAVLVGERGGAVSEKIVRDVMRERKLQVIYGKKAKGYSSYAGEPDEAPENIPLGEDGTHDFHASAPNEKWVSDITEFAPPDAPKVYLSAVIDLFDGKPVGWRIGLHPDSGLANGSLLAACSHLKHGEHPWCHTDRGCHYRWPGWKAICERHGITRSMSRKGHSPDNAACEGFFGRLKNEFFHGRDWKGVSAEEFMERLDAWMRFYSEGRLKAFREDGRWVYDTIDNRRRRLGLAA